MKTVILYNIISLIIIFVLIFVLRIVSKSDLRKNQQLIIKVITTILIVCVIAFGIGIRSLQLPGKKRLKTDELLRGFHLDETFNVQ